MIRDGISFILLAHNEAGTIQAEIRSIFHGVISSLPNAELIVAEDGSRDGTRQEIEKLQAHLPFRVVGSSERKGYTRAVIDAIAASDRSWICIFDGGMKHDPADFWKLHDVRDQFDIIVGRKTDRTDQWYRKLMTRGLNAFLRLYFKAPVFDADSGFRLYNRRVVDSVIQPGLNWRGFVSAEIALRAIAVGLRYGEVPVVYRQRQGESRGLPVRRMPDAIRQLFKDSRALKSQLAKSR